jgi:hypothetical protein
MESGKFGIYITGGDYMSVEFKTGQPMKLTEITIYQKASNIHTKFILLENGNIFGKENFALAKEWRDQGLLGEKAASLINRIVAIELQKEVELQKDKVFQIEI